MTYKKMRSLQQQKEGALRKDKVERLSFWCYLRFYRDNVISMCWRILVYGAFIYAIYCGIMKGYGN